MSMFGARWCVVAAIGSVLALAAAGCQYTVRSSVSSAGAQGNYNTSDRPALSADGRYAAFMSAASNLVAGDTNGRNDIFVRDHQTGTTSLVSRSTGGTQGNGTSDSAAISADGRYVAFRSGSSNLVAGDTNAAQDVFVHDRQTGATTRVSVASDGTQADSVSNYRPAISADGRYVAFTSIATNLVPGDTNGMFDVFVRDRQTLTTTRASVSTANAQGNGSSRKPAISDDGQVVAFQTEATNLVAGDTNGEPDVVVRAFGLTSLASQSSGGTRGNGDSLSAALSADGIVVAFTSDASNLVAGDTNAKRDVFVRNRSDGMTTRVSLSSGGVQADNNNGGTPGDATPGISEDGRFVAFDSLATNLDPYDTNGQPDVFVRDRVHDRTLRVSTNALGGEVSSPAGFPALSADGRYAAFTSPGPFDPADTNGFEDVYLKFVGEPKPASIYPYAGHPGESVDVTIDGSGFEAGDQVGVSGGGVNVTNVQVVDDSTITATFEILPGASTGARWVAVSRAAGGWNSALGAMESCVGCFEVIS